MKNQNNTGKFTLNDHFMVVDGFEVFYNYEAGNKLEVNKVFKDDLNMLGTPELTSVVFQGLCDAIHRDHSIDGADTDSDLSEENEALLSCAFISRHVPTEEQKQMAMSHGYTLTHVGDADAFSVTPSWVKSMGEFNAVCVVHPAAALRLTTHYVVAVFENGQRSEGGKMTFYPKALHFYDVR